MPGRKPPQSVPEYIAACPQDVRPALRAIRAVIREAAPGAEEAIRYGIPTFILHGNLISFAAYRHHIGLYPAPQGSPAFNRRLAPYRAQKSTVRFPLDRPVPLALVREIVRLRLKDQRDRARARAAARRR